MTTMYNTAGYDPGAYLTNLKNIALQKYNQQMGASGGAADISAPTASQATNIARGLQRNLTSSSPLFKVDFGMEYPLRPEAANKAKDLYATALSKYNTSPTAQRLIDTGKIGQAIQPSSGGLSDLQVMYHGTSPESASQIKAGEFKGGKVPTWAGTGKVFVTPNIDVASRYPTTGPGDIVETVVPKSSTRLPGGGISIGDLSPLQKLGKVLPVAGNVISAVDAYQRAKEGDYAGAALSGLGALPVVGIPATLAQYATDALGLTGQEREEPQEEINFSGLPIGINAIYPNYFEDKEEFDRTGRGVYAGRPVYYSEGPDLPQGGLVYSGTAEDLENFYSSMQ